MKLLLNRLLSNADRQQYRSHAIGALFDQPHMNWGNQQVKLVFNYDKEVE